MLGRLNCADSPDSLSIIAGTTDSPDCAQNRSTSLAEVAQSIIDSQLSPPLLSIIASTYVGSRYGRSYDALR